MACKVIDIHEAELGVLVLAVLLEVLADGDSLWSLLAHGNWLQDAIVPHLLDKHVQVLWDRRSQAY